MEQPAPLTGRANGRWTVVKIRIFIAALCETGSVSHASRAAGMSRSSAHRLRARMAGKPFDIAWDKALAHYHHMLADPFVAADRATEPAAYRMRG